MCGTVGREHVLGCGVTVGGGGVAYELEQGDGVLAAAAAGGGRGVRAPRTSIFFTSASANWPVLEIPLIEKKELEQAGIY